MELTDRNCCAFTRDEAPYLYAGPLLVGRDLMSFIIGDAGTAFDQAGTAISSP
jgi:hypothetical protein